MIKGSYRPTASKARFGEPSVLGPDFPAPHPTTAYHEKWAYVLSVISGWAYAEGQVLADELFFHGLPGCTVHEISVENKALLIVATAYVVVDEEHKVAIIAFRGTEPDSLINWLTDAESAKYAFGSGYVHSGFYANVEAVWANIVDLVDPLVEGEKIQEIYVTGHSLGAAMAIVAAAQIFKDLTRKSPYAKWRDCIRGVYSFASPMVGDRQFAREFEGRFGSFLYRYTYDQDVVPCLPPTSVDTDFEHFGIRRFAHTCEETWTVGGDDRRAELADLAAVVGSFFTRRIDALRPLGMRVCKYSLDDHSPRGYIEVTRNALLPQKGRAKSVGSPPTLLGAFGQAVEHAMSIPKEVLETLLSVRRRPTTKDGGGGPHPALSSVQS